MIPDPSPDSAGVRTLPLEGGGWARMPDGPFHQTWGERRPPNPSAGLRCLMGSKRRLASRWSPHPSRLPRGSQRRGNPSLSNGRRGPLTLAATSSRHSLSFASSRARASALYRLELGSSVGFRARTRSSISARSHVNSSDSTVLELTCDRALVLDRDSPDARISHLR